MRHRFVLCIGLMLAVALLGCATPRAEEALSIALERQVGL